MDKMKKKEEFHITRYTRHDDIDEYLNSALEGRYGSRFLDYRRNWDRASRIEYLPEYPLMLGIEAIDACNYKCEICYRRYKEGSGARIGLDGFKRLVDEGAEYGLPCVIFGGGGEPMMEKKVCDMVRYAGENDVMDILFSTNGALLTPEKIDELVDAGITRMQVSLDAITPDTYKKIRGGDLEYVESMIHYCLEKRKKENNKLPLIRVSFIAYERNRDEAPAFLEKWKDVADIVDIQNHIDYSNVDSLKEIRTKKLFCPQPWQRVNIWSNGDISPCCTFYSKHFAFGNIKTHSVKEVWDGKKVQALRDSLNSGNFNKVCRNCYGTFHQEED